MFHHKLPTCTSIASNCFVRSCGDNIACKGNSREKPIEPSLGSEALGLAGMVNKGELLINVVTLQLAKDDDTLRPKGTGKS